MPVQVRASLWFLISTFLQKAISVISTPIFTRLLTTGQYGEYNVFQSWMGIISVIVTLNLFYGVFFPEIIFFRSDTRLAAAASVLAATNIVSSPAIDPITPMR